jgi:L-arabinokinase
MKIGFSDVLASANVVVTKPGYGILSDCVANAKPIVYADRADFIEYSLLEMELKRFLRNVHIPATELYAGRLGAALAAIESAPAPKETLAGGGAEKAADILMGLT